MYIEIIIYQHKNTFIQTIKWKKVQFYVLQIMNVKIFLVLKMLKKNTNQETEISLIL